MTEEMKSKNPCGEEKEIDEYLNGTICEAIAPDVNDIDEPGDEEYEVDSPPEPKEDDRYEGLL